MYRTTRSAGGGGVGPGVLLHRVGRLYCHLEEYMRPWIQLPTTQHRNCTPQAFRDVETLATRVEDTA